MYNNVTDAFKATIRSPSRTFRGRLKINDKWIYANFKKLSYETSSSSEEYLQLGSAVAAKIELTIKRIDELFENTEIPIEIGLKLPSGKYEYIPVGFFTAEHPTNDQATTTFTAYDRMMKTTGVYVSNLTYPTSAVSVLNEISAGCGVPVDVSNIDSSVMISTKPVGYTYREMIGYIASLAGGFACVDRTGTIVIKWYSDANYKLDVTRIMSFEKDESNYNLEKLSCNVDNSTTLTSGGGILGVTFDNPFMTQDRLDNIFKKLSGFSYRGASVKTLGDVRLDPWDMITVEDGEDTYKVPVMNIQQEYDGGLAMTITSYGKTQTEQEVNFKGPTTQQNERIYSDLILAKELVAKKVDADWVKANTVTAEAIVSVNNDLENIRNNYLKSNVAEIRYATIDDLNVANAKITDLKANMLTADIADLNYAKVDFANVIGQVVGTSLIKDGAVTNEKVQNLSANKITSGTIDASKITVTNLNADNITVGTINGKRIGNGSINLDKLSEEVPTKEYLDKVQDELQGQIDGNIETFTKTEIPTLNNDPAVNWTDNVTRKKHIGDICYVVNPAYSADGYSYRFADTGTLEAPNYEWVLIKDSDVTKALQDIININGEITGIKNFNVEVSSWKTDTSEELSSLKKRTTTIETDYSTKQDVTDKINGIQVGGTNMLLWTTTMPGKFSTDSSGASSKGTVSYQSDGSALVTNNNSNFRFQYHPDVSVMIGSTYVVSAYYKDVSGTQEHQFQIVYQSTTGKYTDFHGVTGTREVENGWKQSYLVFTIPNTIKTARLITIYLRSGTDFTLYTHSYYIKNVKLELGNKVTTWSPAPEDVVDAINTKVSTTVFNEVKQTVDENSANITKMTETISTKADNSAVTTLTNTVNSVKQTANSNSSSISSLTTTVSNVQTTANTAKSTANTAKSTADTANNTANTAKSTADSAKSTATTANNTANTAKSTADSALTKVNTLTTTVTSQGSSITQLQTSINNKVWKTDITESVNNLQVGGRNLLKGTHKTEVTYTYPTSSWVDKGNWVTTVPLDADYYTLSFWAKSTKAGDRIRIHFYNPSNSVLQQASQGQTHVSGDGTCDFVLSTTLTHYWVTYRLQTKNSTRNVAIPRLFAGWGSGTLTFKWEKVEEGTKATSWSPAPEDVDSSISVVDSKVTTVSNSYTTLSQTVNSLSSTVSGHTEQIKTKADNSTVTTINNKVTSLTTDLSGFKTTVSNTYATKSSLSNYATTTAMNSAIKQSASSITTSVSATYATKSSLSSYATTASLSAYIAKTDTGTLKSCIEAIADTINITARGGLNLGGNRFTLNSTNTTITANGTITSNNIIANYGKIAQWNIANNSINSTTSDSKYWAGMTTPSKGSDWVYAIMSNSGTASVPSWSPQWYVAGNGFMYAASAAIAGSITATKSGVLTTTVDASGISVTGSDNSTVITAQGFLTNQYLGSTIDCRGTIFDGMLIYPKGKTDLTYEWVAKLSNKSIAISPNNNISVDYCTKMTNEEISIRGELGSSAYAIMATYGFSTGGNLYCGGTKNRMVETEHFGTVLQNALETPTPTFEDYGEGILDESGMCRIYLEDKFIETIDTTTTYTVFLTKYGVGDIYVSDRQPDYFEVTGTPNLTFSWQLLATQRDYNSIRLDEKTDSIIDKVNSDELFKMTTEFIAEWEGDLDYAE